MIVSLLAHICVTRLNELTHWEQGKMKEISQTAFFNAFFFERKWLYFASNFTEFLPKGQIESRAALVHVMACCQKAAKPFYKLRGPHGLLDDEMIISDWVLWINTFQHWWKKNHWIYKYGHPLIKSALFLEDWCLMGCKSLWLRPQANIYSSRPNWVNPAYGTTAAIFRTPKTR